ncbi:MAG: protein kinase [Acidobacteria bacterium]|nr:protein kinase [Acidobacteriota bacterium]
MSNTLHQFQFLDCLSTGDLGNVYLACDTRLDRNVVVKFLPLDGNNLLETRRLIATEARLAAALAHPNIATIYEFGEAEDRIYFVMEYVEGRSLRQKIAEGGFPLSSVLELVLQIAEALEAAHARNIVHCDLKPSNIMVTTLGRVKLLDFGLARLTTRPDDDRNPISDDVTGLVSGTLKYLSPEQAQGKPLDGRTDLFSLGIILFELLTGQHPFPGENEFEVVQAICTSSPPLLSRYRDDIPLELERVCRKLLEKDSLHRYQASELVPILRKLKASVQSSLPQIDPQPAASLPQPGPLARESSSWRAHISGFLGQPFFGKAARAEVPSTSQGSSGIAFRGLLPFQETDQDSFYGRETDIQALFLRIQNPEFRFGILFGESGCGKTSLLRAGLVPKLWREGWFPLVCRSYQDPLVVLSEECRKQTQVPRLPLESPLDYLTRAGQEMESVPIIIFDQFEEFFLTFRDRRDRQPFTDLVVEAYHSPAIKVKFLFSIRSDLLYRINSEFVEQIPDPLMNSRLYHLQTLNLDQAAEIIERSVAAAGIQFETGLSRLIVQDLAVGETVLPSELQIVGDQLQHKQITSIQKYKQVGGKETLVHGFLEEVMTASSDRTGIQLVLRSLISDENTRLTLTLEDLASRLHHTPVQIQRLLRLLVQSRLVREIQEDEPWRYELVHEYLIDKINRITGKTLDTTQRANRLFRHYLSQYGIDQRARIPLSQLWTIHRYADLPRGPTELRLLRKSLIGGLLMSGMITLVLVVGLALVTALASIRDSWDGGVRLTSGHTAPVRKIAFSPDGRLLVSCGEDAQVIVWDFLRRERIATLRDHTGSVLSLAFSPDGKWFATGSADHRVIIWDARTLKKVTVLTAHLQTVTGLAFSSDGELLGSSSDDSDLGRTIFWEVATWRPVKEVKFRNDWKDLFIEPKTHRLLKAFAISPDWSEMIDIEIEGKVVFQSLSNQAILKKVSAHHDTGRTAAFSPDGRYLATGADRVVLWDARTRTQLDRLEYFSGVWDVAFSPDGQWLVSSHGDGGILIWDLTERECVANLNEHAGIVRRIVFSPDGKWLASGGSDGSMMVWSVEHQARQAVFLIPSDSINDLAFSQDGRLVATADQVGDVHIWDFHQNTLVWTIHHPKTYVMAVAFSPDGHFLATSQGVYDLLTRQPVALSSSSGAFPGKYGEVYELSFSRDGQKLVMVSPYGDILVWDTGSWRLQDQFKFTGFHFLNVSLSPDGTSLVTGEEGGSVRLWALNPLRQTAVLGRHAGWVRSVEFSPTGAEVVSTGDDKTIALWSVPDRKLKSLIGTHATPVQCARFSPDGRRLATSGNDSAIRLYTRRQTLWNFQLD